MNYLGKLIRYSVITLGFLLIIGGVGNADYANEIGEYISLHRIIIPIVFGFMLLIIAGKCKKWD